MNDQHAQLFISSEVIHPVGNQSGLPKSKIDLEVGREFILKNKGVKYSQEYLLRNGGKEGGKIFPNMLVAKRYKILVCQLWPRLAPNKSFTL